jgi:hypothetical protein
MFRRRRRHHHHHHRYPHRHHRCHHHIIIIIIIMYVMELGHLLARFSLTYLEVSSSSHLGEYYQIL